MNEGINSNIPKPNEPPVENKQNNDVPQEETFSFPSPEEMGDLLKEADKMATEALVTEEEIGKRVNEREKQVEQLRYLRAFEEYLKWLGQLSPMENLNPGDYGALAEEKIIDRDSKDPLQKRILENMDTVLYRFQSIKSLSPDEAQTLAKLFTIREKFREEIKRRILEEQNRISTRRGEIIERTLAVYKRRTEETEATIREIEANPRVLGYIEAREAEKRTAAAKVLKEGRLKLLQAKFIPDLKSVRSRQNRAFKKIKEVIDDQDIETKLKSALGEQGKTPGIFEEIRKKLAEAYRDKKIKENEVAPWMMMGVHYGQTLSFLQDKKKPEREALDAGVKEEDESMKKLLEEWGRAITGQQILRQLLGNGEEYMFAKKKSGEKKKDGSAAGAEKAPGRAPDSEKKGKVTEEIKSLIEKGGFEVNVPVVEREGKKKTTRMMPGVVLIKMTTSKRGSEQLEVVGTAGAATEALKTNKISVPNMSQFPEWLRKSAGARALLAEYLANQAKRG